MNLLNEVIMNDCSQVYHYLLNKTRYVEKNLTDKNQIIEIQQDINNPDNGQQILSCSLTNPRIQELYLRLLPYLK